MDIRNIWLGRKEEDIQDCLREVYERQGYLVANVHKSDRRHENGIDLEIKNSDETIHIQTKKKPLKQDIEQLQKLVQSSAQKRIYIYVEDPAVNFKAEMEKVKDKVDFWDKSKLNDYLISQNSVIYFRFLFLSTNLVRRIVDVLEEIMSCEPVAPKNLEMSQLPDWWLFKDRSVKLHASLEHVYSHYTKEFLSKDRIEEIEVRCYLGKILSDFDIINTNSCLELLSIVKDLKRKYPFLLSKFVKVTEQRSNWIGMPHIDTKVGSLSFRELVERWVLKHQPLDSSFYNLANFYLKRLTEVAEAIEDGVDWIHEGSFGTPVLGKSRL